MYRGRLWTMRQFAGFATPEETNRRYRYLLEQGQTGLSVAFDLPTLMGYDSDHPLSLRRGGQVRRLGLLAGGHGDPVRGHPAGRRDGVHDHQLAGVRAVGHVPGGGREAGRPLGAAPGTLQNDILKEYIAQKEYIYPPRPSMRLVTDTIEFAARRAPRYNPISISGYHIREAGSTAVQELAFTLRDGIEYVEWALERGLPSTNSRPG
jgi:methylmalonyl-CoA mutase, N-terminal domain